MSHSSIRQCPACLPDGMNPGVGQARLLRDVPRHRACPDGPVLRHPACPLCSRLPPDERQRKAYAAPALVDYGDLTLSWDVYSVEEALCFFDMAGVGRTRHLRACLSGRVAHPSSPPIGGVGR